jgi:hypothetical protein
VQPCSDPTLSLARGPTLREAAGAVRDRAIIALLSLGIAIAARGNALVQPP